MNELEKLEQRATKLLEIIEYNNKKLGQHRFRNRSWDLHKIETSMRVILELYDVASMINELLELPDREIILGNY